MTENMTDSTDSVDVRKKVHEKVSDALAIQAKLIQELRDVAARLKDKTDK